jgi:hypothetical protein
MNLLKNMSTKFYTYRKIIAILASLSWFSPRQRDVMIAALIKMGLEWKQRERYGRNYWNRLVCLFYCTDCKARTLRVILILCNIGPYSGTNVFSQLSGHSKNMRKLCDCREVDEGELGNRQQNRKQGSRGSSVITLEETSERENDSDDWPASLG